MIGAQVVADVGENTGELAARGFDFRILARQTVHIGRRAAQVRDDAGESRCLVTDRLNFTQDRIFRSALDDAAFMLGN